MQLDQEQIEELLKKLQQSDKPLTPDEIETVRDVLTMWRFWKSLGFLGRIVIWGLMTLASVLIAWQQIKDSVSSGWFG